MVENIKINWKKRNGENIWKINPKTKYSNYYLDRQVSANSWAGNRLSTMRADSRFNQCFPTVESECSDIKALSQAEIDAGLTPEDITWSCSRHG